VNGTEKASQGQTQSGGPNGSKKEQSKEDTKGLKRQQQWREQSRHPAQEWVYKREEEKKEGQSEEEKRVHHGMVELAPLTFEADWKKFWMERRPDEEAAECKGRLLSCCLAVLLYLEDL
ncbi:hypothetical protein KI387_042465, partial [Taxus chinensis]